MIDAARVEEIRAALTCAYQVPEWGEITDMAHELFKFIDTLCHVCGSATGYDAL